MAQGAVLVFDDVLGDTAAQGGTYLITKHTSLEHTELLSAAAQIGLQAVATRLSGSTSTPLTLTLEHSANGHDWKPKNSTPELSATIVWKDDTATLGGGERWPARPSLRFVRLRIEVGNGHNPFAIDLKVYVTARRRGVRAPPLDEELEGLLERLPRAELLFGVRGEVLNELGQLVLGAGHLGEEERVREALQGLSVRSQREVFGLVNRIRRMEPEAKRLLLSLSRGLVRLLSEDLEAQGAEAPTPLRTEAVVQASEEPAAGPSACAGCQGEEALR